MKYTIGILAKAKRDESEKLKDERCDFETLAHKFIDNYEPPTEKTYYVGRYTYERIMALGRML